MDSHIIFETVFFSLFFGINIIILAKKVRISTIPLLFIAGICLGPIGLNLIQPSSLGIGLSTIVYLAVAIILFEGGLTLDYSGYKKTSRVIKNLLTIGVLTTWLSISTAIYFLFNFSLSFSLLAGSLVIVTGPTVITPLLKRVKVEKKLYQILHWEGVLIDPIGVFVAITCFEIVYAGGFTFSTFQNFLLRLVTGVTVGAFCGWLSYYLIKKRYIPEDTINIFIFSVAIFTFGVCDLIIPESGILAVVVTGFILGIKKPSEMEELKKFKLDLTEILIGMLFIILSANINFDRISNFGWNGLWLILFVLLVARPLSIFTSSLGVKLNIKQKLFLSWIAPRGIVAASVAALFALKLSEKGHPHAWFLETFTFTVIASTVILQGFSANFFAKLLNVKQKSASDWVIVGAHAFSQHLSKWISKTLNVSVLVIDTNPKNIQLLVQNGVRARVINAMEVETILEQEPHIGFILCLTDNRDLNILIAEKWLKFRDIQKVYLWDGEHQAKNENSKIEKIWNFLPKPSILSSEIKNREIILRENEKNFENGIDLLFQLTETNITVNKQDKSSNINLTIQREKILLLKIIKKEHIFFIDVVKQKELYEIVVKKLSDLHPQLPCKKLTQDLVEREVNHPTGIGKGIALPHAYSKKITSPICSIIRLDRQIEWKAYDKMPVKLIFLLISPTGDPDQHLSILSQISHLIDQEDVRQKLFHCGQDELLEIIKRQRSHLKDREYNFPKL